MDINQLRQQARKAKNDECADVFLSECEWEDTLQDVRRELDRHHAYHSTSTRRINKDQFIFMGIKFNKYEVL